MFIRREAWPYFSPLFLVAITIICLFRSNFLLIGIGILFFIISLAVLFFFRDPPRHPVFPMLKGVLSPADGRLVEINHKEGKTLFRIFLSIFNVHIQRAPISGTVKDVIPMSGEKLSALHPQAHQRNQSNRIQIVASDGGYLLEVKQIAGVIARRISCWVNPGEQILSGEKLGLIHFGSQVELTVQGEMDLNVRIGDKLRAGITLLGVIR